MPAKRHPVARASRPCVSTLILAFSLPSLAQAQTQPTTAPAPITAIATIEPFWSADQYARATGYISEVKADIGDHVKKGQLLATIDAPELERDLAAAQATLTARRESANAAAAVIRQAEASLTVAQKQLLGLRAEADLADVTLKRQQQLFETKAATEQQIDDARAKTAVTRAAADVAAAKIASAEADLATAKANAAVAQAQVQVAQAEADRAQTLASFARITAPFDGVVTRRLVSPGDLVQATTAKTPLFTCQQLDTVRVFCDLPESGASAITEGAPADIALSGVTSALHGTVTRISSSLNPGTRTMRVEIDLPNPQGALRPGSYAQVTFIRR